MCTYMREDENNFSYPQELKISVKHKRQLREGFLSVLPLTRPNPT